MECYSMELFKKYMTVMLLNIVGKFKVINQIGIM